MLLTVLCAAAAFLLLTMVVVAKVAQGVFRRVGLDPMATLLWLGLAEEPARARSAGRRLGEYVR